MHKLNLGKAFSLGTGALAKMVNLHPRLHFFLLYIALTSHLAAATNVFV